VSAPDGPEPAGEQCPLPIRDYPRVLLAHGGGGHLARMLIERVFLQPFDPAGEGRRHDGAVLGVGGTRLAFSTDSFVISPRFFPGGDIGSLAVHGTVNDLAMCGARPLALSAGLILEEGLPLEELWRVARSMRDAAAACGVPIVTGDTKVVERGKGDGLFVNTAGIGVVPAGVEIDPRRARPGDAVLISGTIADHGVAILSVREGLGFETTLRSDSAPLHGLVEVLLADRPERVHVLRDPTRGGVAAALSEIAARAGVGVVLDERALPLHDAVRGACEILGLDPLHVANEGKLLAIVDGTSADELLAAMRRHPAGACAARIGRVVAEHSGEVLLRSSVGGTRVVDCPDGEPLPRIC